MAKFVFIGGGFSTTAALYALAQKAESSADYKGLTITVVDKKKPFGTGMAYSDGSEPYHLLNAQADRMSINPEDKRDFFNWLNKNGEVWRPAFPDIPKILSTEMYFPRRLYGMYLEQRFEEAVSHLREYGATVDLIEGEVVGRIVRGGKEYLKVKRPDESYRATQATDVVLATGNPPPRPLVKLVGHPEYIGSIWKGAVQAIPPAAPVVVLGLGLGAADVLRTLAHNNHKGSIVIVSSTGEFPSVHRNDYRHYKRQHLTDSAVGALIPPTADSYWELLQKEIAVAKESGYDALHVIDSLRDLNDKDLREDSYKQTPFSGYWSKLSDEEKVRWNRDYSPRYNKMLFRMSPETHAAIASLPYKVRQESLTEQRPIAGTYYINCTGPDCQATPMVKALLDDGVCQLHPAGGFRADKELRLIAKPGSTSAASYSGIGPIFWGERFATVSAYDISRQAMVLAQRVKEQQVIRR